MHASRRYRHTHICGAESERAHGARYEQFTFDPFEGRIVG